MAKAKAWLEVVICCAFEVAADIIINASTAAEKDRADNADLSGLRCAGGAGWFEPTPESHEKLNTIPRMKNKRTRSDASIISSLDSFDGKG